MGGTEDTSEFDTVPTLSEELWSHNWETQTHKQMTGSLLSSMKQI